MSNTTATVRNLRMVEALLTVIEDGIERLSSSPRSRHRSKFDELNCGVEYIAEELFRLKAHVAGTASSREEPATLECWTQLLLERTGDVLVSIEDEVRALPAPRMRLSA